MKRIIAFLMAFLIVLGVMPATTFAATPTLLFSERFSDYIETQKVPYTIKSKGKDDNNQIFIKEDNGSAYLEVDSEGRGLPAISFNINKKARRLILNFNVNVKANASDIVLGLIDYDTVTNSRLLSFTAQNTIKAADGSLFEAIAEFENNKWQDISFVINTDGGTYELYINGAKIGETFKLPLKNNGNTKVSWSRNIRAVCFDTYNRTGMNTTFDLERIIAYESTEILSDAVLLEMTKSEEQDDEEVVIPDLEVFAYQDFNSFEPRATSVGIGTDAKGNLIYIDENPSEEDLSVKLESVCEDNFFVLTSFSRGLTDSFVCDFKILLHDMRSKVAFTLRDPAPSFLEVLIFNTAGQIRNNENTVIGSYSINTWYRCQLVINVSEKTYDIYINDVLVNKGAKLSSSSLKSVGLARLHVYPPQIGGSMLNVDDWRVYGGGEIVDEETLKLASSGARSSYFINQSKTRSVFSNKFTAIEGGGYFFANGKRKPYDVNDKSVRAFVDNNVLMLPVRAVANEMMMDISWNEEEEKAYLKYGENTVSFKENTKEYIFNGTTVQSEAEVVNKGGRMYIPFNVFNDLLGGQIYRNSSNNMFSSEYGDNKLDLAKDKDYINEMGRYLIFDRPSPQNVMELLAERYPNNEHPRIMVEPGGFERIKKMTETDEYMKLAFANLEKSTEPILTAPLLKYDPAGNGGHILEISREMLRRAKYLGLMYNLTGDEKYAECLWKNLEACGKFPDWYPGHYLDIGEMAFAFAVGYDWLYDYWTKDRRKFLETAMEEKALKPTLDLYESYNSLGYWIVTDNNWNVVCNGGVAIAALAVGDVMPEITGKTVHYALWGLESMMKEYYPDGSYGEGITYWQYALKYLVSFASALNTSLGDDFGLSAAPGMANTGYFILHGTGPKGIFNFADAGTAYYGSPEVLWLSSKMKNPELTKMLLFHRQLYNLGAGGDDLVWYDPEMNREDIVVDPPNDAMFRGIAETTFMRSKYTDVNAVYGAMKGGLGNVNHGHLDSGSFILDAMGERWILDLGSDSYSLPEFFSRLRWNYYRNRAEGHNTLIFNPSSGADQNPSAVTKIIEFDTKPKGAYSIMDLTPAYKDNATEVKRGMMLADDRTNLVIRDEFNLQKSSEMYWFAHTRANINILPDGKSAILTIGNKQMYVKMDSDLDAQFIEMDALPLPSTPRHSGENKNAGVKKLAIHMQNVTKGYINVKFIPLYRSGEMPDFEILSQPVSLADWKNHISDGELIPFGADEIKVNGEPIADFDVAKRIYRLRYPFGTTTVPKVEAESDTFDVEVIDAQKMPGVTSVVVTDRENPKKKISYSIEFVVLPQIGVIPEGVKEQKIVAVDVSEEPQPENPAKSAIDGDFSTRWAAPGVQWIQFDLGGEFDVTNIELAWMSANQRIYPFEVYLSEDGENFTNALTAENSGTTNALEIYQLPKTKARYVRVKAFGNSVNEWCSMTEAKVYVAK